MQRGSGVNGRGGGRPTDPWRPEDQRRIYGGVQLVHESGIESERLGVDGDECRM